MLKDIWSSKEYYQKIGKWDKLDHPGLIEVFSRTKNDLTILDVGCGDGTKLNHLGSKSSVRTGTEVTNETIAFAKKKHPKFNFVKAFGEKLPFSDNSFDAVTCLFVLEHTKEAKDVISEIIRVTKRYGNFYLLAPNFGAPNRCSPNFKGSRFKKLLIGFIKDLIPSHNLEWNKVTPTISKIEEFESDLDTTTEPYLGSLLKFLQYKNINIVKYSSFWEMELTSAGFIHKIFKIFRKNWGPHLFVIGEKQ